MKLVIKVITEEGNKRKRQTYETGRSHCLIGRAGCDLTLSDTRCSGHHALVYESKQGGLVIQDLKSKNGTFVNGQRIQESQLKEGDVVAIGSTLLQISEFRGKMAPRAAEPTQEGEVVIAWPAMYNTTPQTRKTFAKHVSRKPAGYR